MKNNLYTGLMVCLLFQSTMMVAQTENALIRSGNRYYRQKQIDQSQQQYQKALEKAPDNPAANYNLGNAQFRKNNFGDAVRSYDASIEHSQEKGVREKGQYNKGVAMVKDQKLEESIGAWKNALKLDPDDTEARENLQKALLELKKKQPKEQKKDQDQQNKKQNDQKNNNQKEQQQPKEQQSKLSKQQVEQLLNALQQREKEAQEKMNQSKIKSLKQPEKDW